MALWSRLRPKVEDSYLTTEGSRQAAKRAKKMAETSASRVKATTPEVVEIASSLTKQRELNHFTDLLTISFLQKEV